MFHVTKSNYLTEYLADVVQQRISAASIDQLPPDPVVQRFLQTRVPAAVDEISNRSVAPQPVFRHCRVKPRPNEDSGICKESCID